MNETSQYISYKRNLPRRKNETPIYKSSVGPVPDCRGVRKLSVTPRLVLYIIRGFGRLPSSVGKGIISNRF